MTLTKSSRNRDRITIPLSPGFVNLTLVMMKTIHSDSQEAFVGNDHPPHLYLVPLKIHRRIDPFVSIAIENSRYTLKTMDQISEFEQVLALRAKIFTEEYSAQLNSSAFDIDPYDFSCDHLIILDKQSGLVIGTYRMLCSQFVNHFYSETEFEMKHFLNEPGIKLELGRACIAREHRRGAVLSLLWRGIIRYAIHTKAEYLFGCSSVKTESPADAKAIIESLKKKDQFSEQWGITPTEKYRMSLSLVSEMTELNCDFPSLFQSYLNAGAKVFGEPALDREFKCLDFLTILRLRDIAESYEKRYQV